MNITLSKVEEMDPKSFSFGAIMTIATQLDTQLDNVLKEHDLTSKQLFLMMIVGNLFNSPPTLKQAACEIGSSYQNVKQMAIKLESKKLLRIERDQEDARALRLVVTSEASKIWETLNPSRNEFLSKFYNGVSEADMIVLRNILLQLMKNLLMMNEV